MSNLKLHKVKIHPKIDIHLDEILDDYTRTVKIGKGDFIALCIAEKLGVELDHNYLMSDDDFKEYKINYIDETIERLEQKKAKLEQEV